MKSKIDHLERTVLELATQLYRLKHQIDEISRTNDGYKDVFASLKQLMDERGIISAEDFEDAIALDKILNLNSSGQSAEISNALSDELKKVVN